MDMDNLVELIVHSLGEVPNSIDLFASVRTSVKGRNDYISTRKDWRVVSLSKHTMNESDTYTSLILVSTELLLAEGEG